MQYNQSVPYEIRLKGHLDAQWSDWFDGLNISLEDNGNTCLTGPIADQSALHGLLAKIRDLGLPLISLRRVSSPQETENAIENNHTKTISHEQPSLSSLHDT